MRPLRLPRRLVVLCIALLPVLAASRDRPGRHRRGPIAPRRSVSGHAGPLPGSSTTDTTPRLAGRGRPRAAATGRPSRCGSTWASAPRAGPSGCITARRRAAAGGRSTVKPARCCPAPTPCRLASGTRAATAARAGERPSRSGRRRRPWSAAGAVTPPPVTKPTPPVVPPVVPGPTLAISSPVGRLRDGRHHAGVHGHGEEQRRGLRGGRWCASTRAPPRRARRGLARPGRRPARLEPAEPGAMPSRRRLHRPGPERPGPEDPRLAALR